MSDVFRPLTAASEVEDAILAVAPAEQQLARGASLLAEPGSCVFLDTKPGHVARHTQILGVTAVAVNEGMATYRTVTFGVQGMLPIAIDAQGSTSVRRPPGADQLRGASPAELLRTRTDFVSTLPDVARTVGGVVIVKTGYEQQAHTFATSALKAWAEGPGQRRLPRLTRRTMSDVPAEQAVYAALVVGVRSRDAQPVVVEYPFEATI
jgi:hypothetical protein